MQCIPAIDIQGGEAVRLVQGDFARRTSYGDPMALAARYAKNGAERLHVVDLDAARTGELVNLAVVADLVRSIGVPVHYGGGVRSLDTIDAVLAIGADRVILGTAAIDDDHFSRDAAERFPRQILISLDHLDRDSPGSPVYELAVRGWAKSSGVGLAESLKSLAEVSLGGVIVTNISRDGTLDGPDLEGLSFTLERSAHDVYASGGVASVRDLEYLAALNVEGRRLAGVVVGKALASGSLTMKEAIAACER
ncbi:MAG: 1-(5-phosphoribosyl)-5-[(5-phosphoribosylamino)methylideneamino] imidazole-4-carboxamide isomerase [Acidimicrobiales bacterium]